MLYQTELNDHIGANDGNRTHMNSLEGCDSTVELHPHKISEYTITMHERRFGMKNKKHTR